MISGAKSLLLCDPNKQVISIDRAGIRETVLHRKNSLNLLIKVPSTSANLGHGFDTLGIAIDTFMLHINLVRIFKEEPEKIVIECEDDAKYPTEKEDNLIYQVCKTFKPNLTMGFHIQVRNEIPMGRGLGSSGAAIVGGILLAVLLDSINATDHASTIVSFNEILKVAYQFENHFDNIGPSLTGGLVSALSSAAHPDPSFRLNYFQISKAFLSHIQAFALIPQNTQTATKEARSIVSKSLPLDRHIESMQKALTLVSLISCQGHEDEFDGATQFFAHMRSCLWENFVHMRQRADLIQENGWNALNCMDQVLQDSNVGYLGTTISGSGPTILLFQLIDAGTDERHLLSNLNLSRFFSETIDIEIVPISFSNCGVTLEA